MNEYFTLVVERCTRFWFFQFVFVSDRHNISISYLMLLSIISRNVSPSCPRSRSFGFCNCSLVNFWFLLFILSPKYWLLSASMRMVCSMCVFWVSSGIRSIFIDPLNSNVWRVDWLFAISVQFFISLSLYLLEIRIDILSWSIENRLFSIAWQS